MPNKDLENIKPVSFGVFDGPKQKPEPIPRHLLAYVKMVTDTNHKKSTCCRQIHDGILSSSINRRSKN